MASVANLATATRVCLVSIALSIGFVSVSASLDRRAAPGQKSVNAGTTPSSKRMADGKEWTTANLNVTTSPSYCYDDAERNCRHYGRLYTWESAQRACQSLGDRWRLPTDDEWRQMAKRYGGVIEDAADKGRAAFTALMRGGTSGFDAVFGGTHANGQYERLDAHGIYWTASESGATTAWAYNFGKGGQALNRHSGTSKQMAFSVRCVRE